MRRFIADGPRQLGAARQAARHIAPLAGADSALLLGMGGSALAGGLIDLLRWEQGSRWPWAVVRDYQASWLPGPGTRMFALSYSGQTEEVLAALEGVGTNREASLAVSRGGRLSEVAAGKGIAWLPVPAQPEGFQPRFALYFMFGVLYEVLCRDGLLTPPVPLPRLEELLLESDPEAEGESIASWLGDRIPVVYSMTQYETGVARTWRIKFNENSKMPALAGAIPESNHNELAGLTDQYANRLAVLLLIDPLASDRVRRRFELVGELLAARGYPVRTVAMVGENCLHKALVSLQLADWTTFHLARLRGIDPVAIPAIEEFKRRL